MYRERVPGGTGTPNQNSISCCVYIFRDSRPSFGVGGSGPSKMTMLYINIKKTIERGYQGYRDPNQNSISCCVYILQGFPDFAHPTERERKRDEREKERERDREKEK